jgi:PAS domain S-box-containing protein
MGSATLLATCLCFAILYVQGIRALHQECRAGLVRAALSAAAVVDGDIHRTLVSPEQEDTDAYRRAVDPLRRILRNRPDIRFLYTMVLHTNRTYIVLDATPPGDADRDGIEDHSPIMQPYDTPAPELLDALRTGRAQADRIPVRDPWGTYLSGYAPFHDSAGRQVGVVGVDLRIGALDARLATMRRALGFGFLIAAAVALLSGLGAGWLRYRALASESRHAVMAEALRDREEHYRVLVESLGDALFVNGLAPDGRPTRFIDVNDEACRRLGYSREEMLSMSPPDIRDPSSTTDMPPIYERLRRGEPALFEQIHRTRDGRRIHVEVRASPCTLRGHPAAIALARDIGERKRLEAEREQVREQLLHVQKLEGLGLLAGGIAHDFNNLLMAILGNVDLAIAESPPGAAAGESLAQIKSTALRAADLCRQMLAYSGKGTFAVVPLDLSALVREMMNLLRVSVAKSSVLRCHLPEGLPAIEADATQVRQVAMNLVINASEAMGGKSGVIAVTTGAQECDAAVLRATYVGGQERPGTYVYIEVADTGCGMSAETQARIFDPFFTTKLAGRGLGLAAVMGIVRGHRGAIRVESEEGRGSVFRVLFPATEATVPPAHAPAAPTAWRGSGTILVADDEESVRVVTRRMLERSGFDVLTATDGMEAVDVFLRHADRVVCVLLDLTMPHMDGEAALRMIRQVRTDVPVILASGYSQQEISPRFSGKGLSGFIQKPYELHQLIESVRSVLER